MLRKFSTASRHAGALAAAGSPAVVGDAPCARPPPPGNVASNERSAACRPPSGGAAGDVMTTGAAVVAQTCGVLKSLHIIRTHCDRHPIAARQRGGEGRACGPGRNWPLLRDRAGDRQTGNEASVDDLVFDAIERV